MPSTDPEFFHIWVQEQLDNIFLWLWAMLKESYLFFWWFIIQAKWFQTWTQDMMVGRTHLDYRFKFLISPRWCPFPIMIILILCTFQVQNVLNNQQEYFRFCSELPTLGLEVVTWNRAWQLMIKLTSQKPWTWRVPTAYQCHRRPCQITERNEMSFWVSYISVCVVGSM